LLLTGIEQMAVIAPTFSRLSEQQLTNLGAAALDQKQKYDHGQHADYDPNHCYIVHSISPYKLVSEKLGKRL
jgi:hypothetical protein